VVGNICMDQCLVDVTDVPNVKLGDEVVLMGSQGDLTITADEIAEKVGTIGYEVICSFGIRLPKVYVR
jgi:alanine racemase